MNQQCEHLTPGGFKPIGQLGWASRRRGVAGDPADAGGDGKVGASHQPCGGKDASLRLSRDRTRVFIRPFIAAA